MRSQKIEQSLAVLLFVLCELVSVAFTVRFALSLTGGLEPVVAGIVLELAKLTFSFVVINRLHEHQFMTAALAGALVIALSTLSAIASVAFFDGRTDQQTKKIVVAADKIERLEHQRASLQQEKSLLAQVAEQDLTRQYRARALSAQRRAVDVQRSLNETNQQLDHLLTEAPATAIVPASPLSALFGRYRFLIVLAFAILLEVIGLAALELASDNRSGPVASQVTELPVPHLRVVQSGEDRRLARLSREALQQIQDERLRPVVKDVRDRLGVRQTIAQQVMQRLVEDGALVREGRRYRLANGE